jgi:transducin (beta)-like 1
MCLFCMLLLYSIMLIIFPAFETLGYNHTAFTFAYESLVAKSSVAQSEIPPGALITFLQKGLEYVGIEENINEVSHETFNSSKQ